MPGTGERGLTAAPDAGTLPVQVDLVRGNDPLAVHLPRPGTG